MAGKTHIKIYLADKFGRPGLGQSSQFAVSEKLRDENKPQYPDSRKTELTGIRKTANSHMWTWDLLSINQDGSKGVEWPAGLASQRTPTQGTTDYSTSKNHQRKHGLINSRSFCKLNKDLQLLSTCTQPQPPVTSIHLCALGCTWRAPSLRYHMRYLSLPSLGISMIQFHFLLLQSQHQQLTSGFQSDNPMEGGNASRHLCLCSSLRYQWEGLTTLSQRCLSWHQGQQMLSSHHMACRSNSRKSCCP